MPFPPPNRDRDGFPLLEREAMEFYWHLPTSRRISVSERYRFMVATPRTLSARVMHLVNLVPEVTRQIGPIKQRKEMIYAVDDHGDPLGVTTWNRDPDQRVVALFRLFDPTRVTALFVLARLHGCRRSKRDHILPMHALHGVIIVPSDGNFASLVAHNLKP